MSNASEPDDGLTTTVFDIDKGERLVALLRRFNVGIEQQSESVGIRVSADLTVQIVCALYALVFVVGVVGNVTILVCALKSMRQKATQRARSTVYIFVLCATDLAYLATVLPMIFRQMTSCWLFGHAACKLYMLVESTAKTLTGVVLTVIAYDRFVAVCHPMRHRSARLSIVQTSASWRSALLALISAVLLNLPIAYQAGVLRQRAHQLRFDRLRLVEDADGNGSRSLMTVVYVHAEVCHLPLSTDVVGVTTLALLAGGGFLAPFLAAAVSYVRVYHRLSKRSGRRRQSRADGGGANELSARRIGSRALLASLLYLCCYGPYWTVIVVTMAFSESTWLMEVSQLPMYTYVMWAVHALPLLNTTANWVFYGVMNKQLVQRQRDSGAPVLLVREDGLLSRINADKQRRNTASTDMSYLTDSRRDALPAIVIDEEITYV